jgi:hypothetical protein
LRRVVAEQFRAQRDAPVAVAVERKPCVIRVGCRLRDAVRVAVVVKVEIHPIFGVG